VEVRREWWWEWGPEVVLIQPPGRRLLLSVASPGAFCHPSFPSSRILLVRALSVLWQVGLCFGQWADWQDRELPGSDGTAHLEGGLVMLNSAAAAAAAGTQSASFALLALSSWADLASYVALRAGARAQPEGRVGTTLGRSWTAGSTLLNREQALASARVPLV
jgi:hypothetical protein